MVLTISNAIYEITILSDGQIVYLGYIKDDHTLNLKNH